ncbi:MAG: hypothetical protein Q8P20_03460 [bacterium]|nr:hypothetical protein [bacterium]
MSAIPKKDNYQAAWSGLVLLVVTFMLIAVYFLRLGTTDLVPYDIDPNLVVYQSNAADAAENEHLNEFTSDIYKFKISYPVNGNLTTNLSEEGALQIFTVNISDNDDIVTLNVMPPEMEGITRSSVNIDSEQGILIGKLLSTRIDGTSVKDGSVISMVLIETDDNLYIIEGTGQNFENIVSYFELI